MSAVAQSTAIEPVADNDQGNPPPIQAQDGRPLLFSPITIKGVTARNRIVVSPMCQYSSIDGGPTDWHLVHLGQFAMGGAGIVFNEEAATEPIARKTHGCAGIYNEHHVKAYRRITDYIKEQGAVPAMQMGHAGRKASCKSPWDGFAPLTDDDAIKGKPPFRGISSSPVPTEEGAHIPIELDKDGIARVMKVWQDAAQRTLDAGFDICEIHCAHGYLVQQFMSPLVNQRTDGYGGDLEGRMRFGFELVEAVRKVWPDDKPLFLRISCVDGAGGHWDINDTVAFCKGVKERGIDVIDCSSGGINGPLTLAIVPRVPGYQVPFAEQVRREVGIMTQAVGLITEAEQAEGILQSGQADLIASAREMMWDPYWPAHAAKDLGVEDYMSYLPKNYAWWLERREEVRRKYPTGHEQIMAEYSGSRDD